MKSTVAMAAAVLLAACHKEAPSGSSLPMPTAPASTADLDALWGLAPEGATMGIVVSPRALTMAEHTWQSIELFMKSAPELAPIAMEAQAELQRELGVPTLSLAAAGLVPGKGLASFGITEDSTVMILPVGDRDKFLAIVHGTKGSDFDTVAKMHCKTVRGLYVCAEEPARLETLGKGNLRDRLARAGARGDIEVAGSLDHASFAIVAQLARGSFVVRGTVDGLPEALRENFGRSKTTASSEAAGFAFVALQPLVAKLSAEAPHRPLAGGVSFADVVGALAGVVEIVAPGGSNTLDMRVSLRDPKPLSTLVEHCADLPMAGRLVGGKCHISNAGLEWLAPDVWVEGEALRARVELPVTRGATTAMTAIGAELARGDWSMAFWGRGTVLAANFDWSSTLDPSQAANPAYQLGASTGMGALAMLNEVGAGLAIDGDSARFVLAVRTAWANPDDVVAKLVAIDPKDILTGRAGKTAQAIAEGAPSSPFAADLRAGTNGIAVAMLPIGVNAAVAIPAFLEYKKRSKASEAELQLDRLGKDAKLAYADNGAFPVGKAAVLPINRDHKLGNNCCGGHGGSVDTPGPAVIGNCSADPAAFAKDPVWSALGFSIDEPTSYQYDYQSDGKTFAAHAIGDTDCDGHSASWELNGSIDAAGNPRVELVKPPPGVY